MLDEFSKQIRIFYININININIYFLYQKNRSQDDTLLKWILSSISPDFFVF